MESTFRGYRKQKPGASRQTRRKGRAIYGSESTEEEFLPPLSFFLFLPFFSFLSLSLSLSLSFFFFFLLFLLFSSSLKLRL